MENKHKQTVNEYLEKVCSQIRFQEIHPQIILELRTHLEESIAAAQQTGLSLEDAMELSIRQMGDPLVLGKQLDKTHKPRVEWSLLLLSGAFILLGLMILYFMQTGGLLSQAKLFQRSIPFTFAGLGLCLLLMFFMDYYKLKKFSWYIYWGILLVWFLVLAFGPDVKGASGLVVGSTYIDIAALIPYFMVFALAGIFTDRDWRKLDWLFKSILLLLLPIGFGLATPSLASVAMYTFVYLVLMAASGAGWKRTALYGAGLFLLAATPFFLEPYRMERLLVFLNPYNYADSSGWVYVQALNFIHSAGLWGQGFTFPVHAMPEINSDYIFTYFVYTFGFVAASIFTLFVMLFIGRLFRAAKQVKDRYGALLITGIAALISFQFIWNMLMAIGRAPSFSIGMPFVSYGIAPFLIQMLTLGMVLSTFRRKDLERNLN